MKSCFNQNNRIKPSKCCDRNNRFNSNNCFDRNNQFSGEQPLQSEQPAQAEETEPLLRRLMVPAAAVLLAALGIGVFSLSGGWQPWSHQTGYIQSLNTKFLPASGPQSSKPNISTKIVAAPSSKLCASEYK